MIKSNAYGHGLTAVAKALQKHCDFFGVARMSEAMAVRQTGIFNDIIVCSEFDENNVIYAADFNITLTASSLNELIKYNEEAKNNNRKINIHIKVDSGMNRLGIKELSELYKMLILLNSSKNINLDGIYTHFSDCSDEEFTDKQFDTFMQFVAAAKKEFPNIIAHCASSGAIFSSYKYHLDMVRPGLFLYGYDTMAANEKGLNLLPSMEATANVLAVKKASAGEFIGYNKSKKVYKDMYYAVISAGYGDGYKRALSGCGSVLICGKICKIIGNICMDSFMVRLSRKSAKKIKQGDEAVLISSSGQKKLSFENNSSLCGTIVYEMLTSFTERVLREYIY